MNNDKLNMWIGGIQISYGKDVNNEGISMNIFFSGCSHEPKCKNCQNPSLWDRDSGEQYTFVEIMREIAELSGLITHICFLGGEPLDQPKAVMLINNYAHSIGLYTWMYTGFEYEHIPKHLKNSIDVIVSGKYIDELHVDSFPSSSNQVVTRL